MAAALKDDMRHGLLAPAVVLLAGLATVVVAAFALAGRDHRPVDFTATAVVGSPSDGSVHALGGAELMTGRRLSLRSARGKPILVGIWTSSCAPCRREEAVVRRFSAANPAVAVVAIVAGETATVARARYRRLGWRFPVIFDPRAELATELGANGLPTTLFLDRGRRIVMRIVGAADESALERGLRLASLS